jgi:hypothetical protein
MDSTKATYTGFEFEVEGQPALAIINADLKKTEDRFDYKYSVFIELVPETVNEFGHPEEAEYEYLVDVEKTMMEYLESQTKTVHVGHTTIYRKREIIFYTQTPEPVENFLEHFLPQVGREFEFEIEEDPEWELVEGFYEQL